MPFLAVSTPPLGGFVVGGGEDGLGEPLAEGGVVAEELEEVGVVGEHVGHGPFEGPVELYARVLFVGVGRGILICLVGGHLRRKLLGDHLIDLVFVLPLDVAEAGVEVLDDTGEAVDLRLGLLPAAVRRRRIDLRVLVAARLGGSPAAAGDL